MTPPPNRCTTSSSAGYVSGSLMRREMSEQADVLARLVARAPTDRAQLQAALPPDLAGVTFIARGSSDNAATLGRYAAERAARRPASLAAPALHTLYDAQVDHHGYVAIALSQSGATPEIATVLEAMRHTGAVTVAVTNDPQSRLAKAAAVVYALDAGAELAVPATKTVTAQMLAVTVIASAFGPCGVSEPALSELPDAVERVLGSGSWARDLAARWGPSLGRLVVVSRGYGYAAALETALKITEITGIHAQAFSAADLRHGPIASLDATTPVLIVDTAGPASRDLAELAAIISGRGAPIAWCAPVAGADLPLPAGSGEPLTTILATIRGQQLALALAVGRGENPDAPFGLSKVTLTH